MARHASCGICEKWTLQSSCSTVVLVGGGSLGWEEHICARCSARGGVKLRIDLHMLGCRFLDKIDAAIAARRGIAHSPGHPPHLS